MESFPVTAQMVVKNEERFVWFAVAAVLPFVRRFLITDTGSTDQTWQILKSFTSSKITLRRSKKSVVEVRQEQLRQTKTPWFLLVDGDEIWSKKQLIRLLQLTKELTEEKIAVVNRTRNCVGDVWHYLPEQAGEYQFGHWRGHLNIRLMRALSYEVVGVYPWEEYQLAGQSVNKLIRKLAFSSAWYLHTSHLKRTLGEGMTAGRRQRIVERGIGLSRSQLPEILFAKLPVEVVDPLVKRSVAFEIGAHLITPFKWVKRTLYG